MEYLKGEHQVKLGRSFTAPEESSFVTFRYDFKPASVDTSKPGLVVTGKTQDVTVTLPHVTGSALSHTVYQGSQRSIQKECVLVVNKETGDITLERVSSAVHLKRTREEVTKAPDQVVTSKKSRPLPVVDTNSSLGSISDTDSDSDLDTKPTPSEQQRARDSLAADLALSESGSDSD